MSNCSYKFITVAMSSTSNNSYRIPKNLFSLKECGTHTVVIRTQRQQGKVNVVFKTRIQFMYEGSTQIFYTQFLYTSHDMKLLIKHCKIP